VEALDGDAAGVEEGEGAGDGEAGGVVAAGWVAGGALDAVVCVPDDGDAVDAPVAGGVEGVDVAGGVCDGADFGLSELDRRRSTGGPDSSMIPRGSEEVVFLAGLAARIDASLSHVPSAVQAFVFVFSSAPVTVNRPWETPVRSAS